MSNDKKKFGLLDLGVQIKSGWPANPTLFRPPKQKRGSVLDLNLLNLDLFRLNFAKEYQKPQKSNNGSHPIYGVAANIKYCQISALTRKLPDFFRKSVGPIGYFSKTTWLKPIFGNIRY